MPGRPSKLVLSSILVLIALGSCKSHDSNLLNSGLDEEDNHTAASFSFDQTSVVSEEERIKDLVNKNMDRYCEHVPVMWYAAGKHTFCKNSLVQSICAANKLYKKPHYLDKYIKPAHHNLITTPYDMLTYGTVNDLEKSKKYEITFNNDFEYYLKNVWRYQVEENFTAMMYQCFSLDDRYDLKQSFMDRNEKLYHSRLKLTEDEINETLLLAKGLKPLTSSSLSRKLRAAPENIWELYHVFSEEGALSLGFQLLESFWKHREEAAEQAQKQVKTIKNIKIDDIVKLVKNQYPGEGIYKFIKGAKVHEIERGSNRDWEYLQRNWQLNFVLAQTDYWTGKKDSTYDAKNYELVTLDTGSQIIVITRMRDDEGKFTESYIVRGARKSEVEHETAAREVVAEADNLEQKQSDILTTELVKIAFQLPLLAFGQVGIVSFTAIDIYDDLVNRGELHELTKVAVAADGLLAVYGAVSLLKGAKVVGTSINRFVSFTGITTSSAQIGQFAYAGTYTIDQILKHQDPKKAGIYTLKSLLAMVAVQSILSRGRAKFVDWWKSSKGVPPLTTTPPPPPVTTPSSRSQIYSDAELDLLAKSLRKQNLTDQEIRQAEETHLIGNGELGRDGVNEAGIFPDGTTNYTQSHINQKYRMLRKNNMFTKELAKIILGEGWAGVRVLPNKKKTMAPIKYKSGIVEHTITGNYENWYLKWDAPQSYKDQARSLKKLFAKKDYDIDFDPAHAELTPGQVAGDPVLIDVIGGRYQVQTQMEYPFRFRNGDNDYTTAAVIKRLERDRLGQWELILLDKNGKNFSQGRIILELERNSKDIHIIEIIKHL